MAQVLNISSSAQGEHVATVENTNGVSQSFVSPWGKKPERYWERPDYVKTIAMTIFDQICGSGIETYKRSGFIDVLASWGVLNNEEQRVRLQALRWRDMPAVALHVDGFEHTGWVIVSLNEGDDLYEIELADEQYFAKPGSRHEGIYCDQLANLIDIMVETGGLSKEEYFKRIEDSESDFVKAVKSKMGAKEVVLL